MKVPTNLIKDIVNHYTEKIIPIYGKEEASQLIWILTEHFFGVDRMKLARNPELRITESEMLTIHFAVKELSKNKPVQYITGESEFSGCRFQLNSDVLIPRPETEQMVQMIVNYVSNNQAVKRILDIGTGSGCIAVSLAKQLPYCEVFACDVSSSALELAASNAQLNEMEVNFFEFNLLDIIDTEELPVFDLMVSNPPYVTEKEKSQMHPNVLNYEPHLALFVPDDDPLLFYRQIALFAQKKLKSGGYMILEINEMYGDNLKILLESFRFSEIEVLKDFHGKNRFVSAIKTA
jgi:release factor glutamine methyltransferase